MSYGELTGGDFKQNKRKMGLRVLPYVLCSFFVVLILSKLGCFNSVNVNIGVQCES